MFWELFSFHLGLRVQGLFASHLARTKPALQGTVELQLIRIASIMSWLDIFRKLCKLQVLTSHSSSGKKCAQRRKGTPARLDCRVCSHQGFLVQHTFSAQGLCVYLDSHQPEDQERMLKAQAVHLKSSIRISARVVLLRSPALRACSECD